MVNRPSPSISATEHHWETRSGNDGNLWESKPNKNGVFSWRKLTTTAEYPKSSKFSVSRKYLKKLSKKATKKKSRKSSRKSNGKISNKISKSDYWKAIEMLNWQKDHDFERVEEQFLKLRPAFRIKLANFVGDKINELVGDYDELEIGDSSLNDLMGEVVSRGRFFYESLSLRKLQKMIDTNDFEEGFIYSFRSSP